MAECGAKKRDGTPCRARAIPNGRCRLHGGKSLIGPASPTFKHGRYSKVIPSNLGERYQQALADENLLALNEEIALFDARLGQLLSKVDTGEAGALWRKAKDEYKLLDQAIRDGDAAELKTHMANLGVLLGRGVSDYAAWDEIGKTVALREKLAASERKRLVETQVTLDLRTGQAFILRVLQSVERHVEDRQTLAAIATELRPLIGAPA